MKPTGCKLCDFTIKLLIGCSSQARELASDYAKKRHRRSITFDSVAESLESILEIINDEAAKGDTDTAVPD